MPVLIFRGIYINFVDSLIFFLYLSLFLYSHRAKIYISVTAAVCMKPKSLKQPLGFAEAQQSITSWWFLTLWSWIWGKFCISYLQSRNAMFLANSNQTSKWRLAKPFPSKWLAVISKCTNTISGGCRQRKMQDQRFVRGLMMKCGAVLWYNIHVGGRRA